MKENSKITWVKWANVRKSKRKNGLGFRYMCLVILGYFGQMKVETDLK